MRDKRMTGFNVLRSIVIVLITLAVACFFIFLSITLRSEEHLTIGRCVGKTFEALRYMLVSPFVKKNGTFNAMGFYQILAGTIPTIFTGLATCVMFSANQFNLAGEGASMGGAFVAALVAVYLPMAPVLHPVVSVLAGAAACGLLLYIPAILKVKFGASEMVTSLMLNYVIMLVVLHFLTFNFADRSKGATMTFPFLETARIPEIVPNGSKFTWGFAAAVLASVLTALFMYRTKWGYAIRMIGINESFATYSGLKVGSIIIISQVLGGILAGMGGAIEVLGRYKTFLWKALPGYGWMGVTIAILAKNNPALVPFAAFFVAYLNKGCMQMSTYCDVPAEMIDIIQAAIYLFFAAEQFLSKYRQKVVVRNTRADLEKAEAEVRPAIAAAAKGGETG